MNVNTTDATTGATALLLPAHCVDLWIGPCRTYPVKTTLVHRRVNVNGKCECVQYIVLLVPSSTEVVRTADGTTDPTQGRSYLFPVVVRDVRLRSVGSCQCSGNWS